VYDDIGQRANDNNCAITRTGVVILYGARVTTTRRFQLGRLKVFFENDNRQSHQRNDTGCYENRYSGRNNAFVGNVSPRACNNVESLLHAYRTTVWLQISWRSRKTFVFSSTTKRRPKPRHVSRQKYKRSHFALNERYSRCRENIYIYIYYTGTTEIAVSILGDKNENATEGSAHGRPLILRYRTCHVALRPAARRNGRLWSRRSRRKTIAFNTALNVGNYIAY